MERKPESHGHEEFLVAALYTQVECAPHVNSVQRFSHCPRCSSATARPSLSRIEPGHAQALALTHNTRRAPSFKTAQDYRGRERTERAAASVQTLLRARTVHALLGGTVQGLVPGAGGTLHAVVLGAALCCERQSIHHD